MQDLIHHLYLKKKKKKTIMAREHMILFDNVSCL